MDYLYVGQIINSLENWNDYSHSPDVQAEFFKQAKQLVTNPNLSSKVRSHLSQLIDQVSGEQG